MCSVKLRSRFVLSMCIALFFGLVLAQSTAFSDEPTQKKDSVAKKEDAAAKRAAEDVKKDGQDVEKPAKSKGLLSKLFEAVLGGGKKNDDQPAEPAIMTAEDYEKIQAQRQKEFMKGVAENPEWHPSHEETTTIKPKLAGGRINNYCLDAGGNLLVCHAGAISVVSPEGKVLEKWPLKFTPQAIGIRPDGTVFVGGEGHLAKLDKKGKVLASVETPVLIALQKPGEKLTPKQKHDAKVQEYVDAFMENSMEEDAARKQAEQSVKFQEEFQKKQREQKLEQLTKAGKTREEALEQLEKDEARQEEFMKRHKASITGIAAGEKDLFVSCGMIKGFGYAVWRFDHDLKNPVQIVKKLRGCCGQMDIQTRDGSLFVAENSRHRVTQYDRDGKVLNKFGKRNRSAPEGFGGCCEPKNLRFTSGGEMLACESGPPVIVRRFAPDGKFLGIAGFPTFATGCTRVTVEASKDGETIYVLNSGESKIHVLKRSNKPAPKDKPAEKPKEEKPAE